MKRATAKELRMVQKLILEGKLIVATFHVKKSTKKGVTCYADVETAAGACMNGACIQIDIGAC